MILYGTLFIIGGAQCRMSQQIDMQLSGIVVGEYAPTVWRVDVFPAICSRMQSRQPIAVMPPLRDAPSHPVSLRAPWERALAGPSVPHAALYSCCVGVGVCRGC